MFQRKQSLFKSYLNVQMFLKLGCGSYIPYILVKIVP